MGDRLDLPGHSYETEIDGDEVHIWQECCCEDRAARVKRSEAVRLGVELISWAKNYDKYDHDSLLASLENPDMIS